MGDVVNLNKYRKAREKAAPEKQAAQNRVQYGQSKAEQTLRSLLNEKAERELAANKRDDRDEGETR
jgi:hypothetical protein